MTLDEFLQGMEILRATYGSQAFPAVKEKMIARQVMHIDAREWESICEKIVCQNQRAPTPNDIFESVRSIKRGVPGSNDVYTPWVIKCFDCYQTGWVHVSSKHGETWLLCHCEEGWAQSNIHLDMPTPITKGDHLELGVILLPFPKDKFMPGESEKNESLSHIGRFAQVKWFKEEINKAKTIWGESVRARDEGE
jgi:hypothetical protein